MPASRARRNKCSNSYQLDFTARELSQIQTVLRHIHPTPCASAPAVIHSRVFARTAFDRARGVTKCRNTGDLPLHAPLRGPLSGLTCGERYDGRGVDRPHRVPSGPPRRPPPRHPGACPRSRPRAVPTGRTGSRTADRGRTGTSRGRRGSGSARCPEEQLREVTPRTFRSSSALVVERDVVRERGRALSRGVGVGHGRRRRIAGRVRPAGPAGPDGVGAPRPEELHRFAALLDAAWQKPDKARPDGPPHPTPDNRHGRRQDCARSEHRDRRRLPARAADSPSFPRQRTRPDRSARRRRPAEHPRRPGGAGAGAGVSAGPRRCVPPAGPAIR